MPELVRNLTRKRDFYAGGLMLLIGLAVALYSPSYGVGTLMHMSPGFFPTVLGVLLAFLGVLIAGTALAAPDGDERILPAELQWRGWLCIILGPVMFILLGRHGGLIPATFACVFIAALGDRTTTWKQALVLAAGITVFGVVVFSYLLKIPFPLLDWSTS